MSSGNCAVQLKRAVIAALKADPPLAAIVGANVFDWGSDNAPFPCISVDEVQYEPFDTDTSRGAEMLVHVHAWARGTNAAAGAANLAFRISDVFNLPDTPVTMPDHAVIVSEVRSTKTERIEQLGHSEIVLRFLTQRTT